jgi:protein-disulfide isomerase
MQEKALQPERKQLVIIGIILAIIGIAISSYTLNHHLMVQEMGQTDSFCNINDTFSCDDVAKSEFSEDPYGNPLGIYGMGYFLGLIGLLLVSLKKNESLSRDALHTYAFLVGIGLITSVVLGSISYFKVGALCISCVGIYLTTATQALALWFQRSTLPKSWSIKGLSNGAIYPIAMLVITIGAFQWLKPMNTRNLTLDTPQNTQELGAILKQLQEQQQEAEVEVAPIPINRSAYDGSGEDYRKGSDEAKVVIVEFADFECPACGYASQTLRQLYSEFGEQIQIVFKNYPLDQSCNTNLNREIHATACKSAIYARCAGRHGKFWEMHDQLFDNQRKIDEERLKLWALEIGLNEGQIKACLEDESILTKIKDDIALGDKLGVKGTPTVFINNRKVNARSIDELRGWVMRYLN